jgi:hypothetical protein
LGREKHTVGNLRIWDYLPESWAVGGCRPSLENSPLLLDRFVAVDNAPMQIVGHKITKIENARLNTMSAIALRMRGQRWEAGLVLVALGTTMLEDGSRESAMTGHLDPSLSFLGVLDSAGGYPV